MPDEQAEIDGIGALIPELFYDIISRFIPGLIVLTIIFYVVNFNIDPDFQSICDPQKPVQCLEYSIGKINLDANFSKSFLFLLTAYFIGFILDTITLAISRTFTFLDLTEILEDIDKIENVSNRNTAIKMLAEASMIRHILVIIPVLILIYPYPLTAKRIIDIIVFLTAVAVYCFPKKFTDTSKIHNEQANEKSSNNGDDKSKIHNEQANEKSSNNGDDKSKTHNEQANEKLSNIGEFIWYDFFIFILLLCPFLFPSKTHNEQANEKSSNNGDNISKTYDEQANEKLSNIGEFFWYDFLVSIFLLCLFFLSWPLEVHEISFKFYIFPLIFLFIVIGLFHVFKDFTKKRIQKFLQEKDKTQAEDAV